MAEKAKIRLHIDQFQIEYEGNGSFLEKDIFNMVEKVMGIHAKYATALSSNPPSVNTKSSPTPPADEFDLSVATIAERLDAKTGPDVVLATAAYLTFSQSETKFSRDNIRGAMKSDVSRYDANVSKNLSQYLRSLVKDKCLNNLADGSYALSASKRKEIESALKNT